MTRVDGAGLPAGAAAYPTYLKLGELGLVVTEWGVGALTWHGVELLRGATYPIRDADWGTIPVTVSNETVERDGDRLTLRRQFISQDGAMSGRFELDATAEGRLDMRVFLEAQAPMNVCRAGFTLLHPIVGLAGQPLGVTHSDGRREDTVFPALISPSQPARDIAGMRYAMDGCSIAITLAGEVFEMEDQRNWSDASYKTYCRPLALPFPYAVARGETIAQSVSIMLEGRPARGSSATVAAAALSIPAEPTGETVPAVALCIERGWDSALGGSLAEAPRLIRLDLTAGDTMPSAAGPLDLELITDDELARAASQLSALAEKLRQAGHHVGHVTALPRAYLKSYQPDAKWPSGATPGELVAAARAAFPGARVGGGMLTNFTELNRCRPDPEGIDFITHGTSGIVHAADDLSVFQTIETLPQIFESARALAPNVPYRLGLVSIGMRTNPYGEGLVDNAAGALRTMTDFDPRARTRFGAAWIVAAVAATRGFGIERIGIAAPAGPFGIIDARTGHAWPAYHVVRALHALAGLPRTDIAMPGGRIGMVAARDGRTVRAVVANYGAEDAVLDIGPGGQVAILDEGTAAASTDPDWLDRAMRPSEGVVRLTRHDIAFLSLAKGDAAL